MTAQTDQVQVRKSEQTRLYEAVIDGQVVGTLAYETVADKTALTHSFVDPDRRSRGVGSALAEFALTDLAAAGVRPIVYCSFVSDYVGFHPKWSDAVEISRWGMIPTRSTPSPDHGEDAVPAEPPATSPTADNPEL